MSEKVIFRISTKTSPEDVRRGKLLILSIILICIFFFIIGTHDMIQGNTIVINLPRLFPWIFIIGMVSMLIYIVYGHHKEISTYTLTQEGLTINVISSLKSFNRNQLIPISQMKELYISSENNVHTAMLYVTYKENNVRRIGLDYINREQVGIIKLAFNKIIPVIERGSVEKEQKINYGTEIIIEEMKPTITIQNTTLYLYSSLTCGFLVMGFLAVLLLNWNPAIIFLLILLILSISPVTILLPYIKVYFGEGNPLKYYMNNELIAFIFSKHDNEFSRYSEYPLVIEYQDIQPNTNRPAYFSMCDCTSIPGPSPAQHQDRKGKYNNGDPRQDGCLSGDRRRC